MTRGLVSLLNSEAALASVWATRSPHLARHTVIAISRQQLSQLGMGIGGILWPSLRSLEPVAGLGLDLLFMRHGRDAEREADTLAFRYAGREHYDLREMRDVFAALQRIGELEESSLSRHGFPHIRRRPSAFRTSTSC
jgi:predicted Zn-dependent protease